MSAVLNRFRLFGNRHINRDAEAETPSGSVSLRAAAGPPSRACFAVESRYGELGVSIDIQGVRVGLLSDVEHAIYLGAVERQIEVIEHWLGSHIELSPAAAGSVPAVAARMHGPDSKTTVQLHASAQVLAAMPPLPTEYIVARGMRIEWQRQAVQIDIARYHLNAAEALLLDEGAAMLLPSALTPPAAALLLPEAQFAGVFDAANFTWTYRDQNPQAPAALRSSGLRDDEFFVAAQLIGSATVSNEQLLNLCASNKAMDLADSGDGSMACRLLLDTGTAFSGSLARVAGGAAFFVADESRTDPQCAVSKG